MAVSLSLSVYYYRFKRKPEDDVIMGSLDKIAEEHPTYGFRKMFHMLRAMGQLWNHKKVYRVYVSMGLNIRRKRKRRLPTRVKSPHILPVDCNITWSADFMQDTLINGKSFRVFNVIDDHNREALMSTIDTSLSARRITRELDRLIEWRGAPATIRVDNGPEFTSATFGAWAKNNGVEIRYIQPGKPTQNTLIERFNGIYRKEVLNAYLFTDLDLVRDQTQRWLWQYNNVRPHESLGNRPPTKFLESRGKASFPSLQMDNDLSKESIFMNASL